MKRKAKLFLETACDALVLSIELFKRPHDRGRVERHADPARLRLRDADERTDPASWRTHPRERAKETIGFDACVRRSLSDGKINYLSKEQALVL